MGTALCVLCEVGIADGSEDGMVAEDFLHGLQINPSFNQMRGITVAE